MKTKENITSSLKPAELEVVYSISKVVGEADSIEDALDKITKLSRQVFIFDNAVLYHKEQRTDLEPIFARAIGRGRSSGSDLAWGDIAANEVIETGETIIDQADLSNDDDRLDQQFYLGIPMMVGGQIIGALIYIRFGGPEYTEDQINVATFIATHISQLFERRRLVERIALLEAERKLAQMQDDFIAMVSHELNTPLGFIKGYTTTLLRKDTEWEEKTRREFLNIIDEEADRLSELIENLLDSSRLQAGIIGMNPSEILVETFLRNIIDWAHTHYENLTFSLKDIPQDISMNIDTKRLSQVFENLIGNASKYAPNSEVEISAKIENGSTFLYIADDGPGIPEKHLDNLFERFYRVPERSAGVRGTGLGLFICKQIINAHGGNLTVESKPNKGTVFCIQIPNKSN